MWASSLYAKNNIELYFKGAPAPNGYLGAYPEVLTAFCNGNNANCVALATTQFELFDPRTNQPQGFAYVWGKDYQYGSGSTVCFTEFILYDLKEGQIYTQGDAGGTCGATLDPNLVSPVSPNAVVVIAGGGDGDIVGGTRKFNNLKGSYTDRVFVEFSQNFEIVYYDSLFFSLMPLPSE